MKPRDEIEKLVRRWENDNCCMGLSGGVPLMCITEVALEYSRERLESLISARALLDECFSALAWSATHHDGNTAQCNELMKKIEAFLGD